MSPRITATPAIFLALTAFATLAHAADGDLTTLINNGASSNRVDIVYLGDGYTSAEQGSYASHVNTMNSYLFTANDLVDPLPRYAKFFNVHRVEVISAQSGIDQPDQGIAVNTALDGTFVNDRGITVNVAKASAYLPKSFASDIRFVATNTTRYGGIAQSTSQYGNWANFAGANSQSKEIMAHELGHSFAGLKDEYDYGANPTNYTGGEPGARNNTTDAAGSKWARWIGYRDPNTGLVGAFEGAGTYETGLYRPSFDSKMRSLDRAFDPISKEAFISRIYDFVKPIDSHLANAGTLVDPASLWLLTVDASVFTIEWYADGQLLAGFDDEQLNLAGSGLGKGYHLITAKVFDNTDMVRDPGVLAKMTQSVEWSVSLIAIPEPSAYGLVAAGALPALLLVRRRARRRRMAA